jgi:hypothetical protein
MAFKKSFPNRIEGALFSLYITEKRYKRVGCEGFEPTTSALSRQRSKPTELTSQKFGIANILKRKSNNAFPKK